MNRKQAESSAGVAEPMDSVGFSATVGASKDEVEWLRE
jgi:hypothetical protein